MQTLWHGNASIAQQTYTVTVTAVPGAGGGTITGTIGNKAVVYTTVSSDTVQTAAAAWATALTNAAQLAKEFSEITATAASGVVTIVSTVPGVPVPFTAA